MGSAHVQLVEPIDDMKAFDEEDAQLNLEKGTPRFYIMRLPAKPQGLSFTQITHHKDVTQCLGSLTPDAWCDSSAAVVLLSIFAGNMHCVDI